MRPADPLTSAWNTFFYLVLGSTEFFPPIIVHKLCVSHCSFTSYCGLLACTAAKSCFKQFKLIHLLDPENIYCTASHVYGLKGNFSTRIKRLFYVKKSTLVNNVTAGWLIGTLYLVRMLHRHDLTRKPSHSTLVLLQWCRVAVFPTINSSVL